MAAQPFAYPFLVLSLALVVPFGLAWLAGPGLRPLIWRSALLSAPFGLTSVVFVPLYWQPVRIAEFICGPEDIIFSLANGGTVWALAFFSSKKQTWDFLGWSRALVRYGVVVAFCWALSAGLWLAGMAVMPAVLVSVYGLAGYIVWRRPELLKSSLKAGLGFALLYSLMLTGLVAIWPHFLDQWQPSVRSGVMIWLIPVEEAAWAFGFGLAWPLYMAHVFQARPRAEAN